MDIVGAVQNLVPGANPAQFDSAVDCQMLLLKWWRFSFELGLREERRAGGATGTGYETSEDQQILRQVGKAVSRVSSKTGIGIGLLFRSGKTMTWFKLYASFKLGPEWAANERSVKQAVAALAEAYSSVLQAKVE